MSADERDLEVIGGLVRSGKYETVSEFIRRAVSEKLERERASQLAEEVARYVSAEDSEDDDDLVNAQAFDDERQRKSTGTGSPSRARRSRASR